MGFKSDSTEQTSELRFCLHVNLETRLLERFCPHYTIPHLKSCYAFVTLYGLSICVLLKFCNATSKFMM